MATVKCSVCGETFQPPEGISEVFCPFCETKQLVQIAKAAEPVEFLLKHGMFFLEEEKWNDATDQFCKALEQDPCCVAAHLGILLAEYQCCSVEQLKDCQSPFDQNEHYYQILQFGDRALINALRKSLAHTIMQNNSPKEMAQSPGLDLFKKMMLVVMPILYAIITAIVVAAF